MGQASLVRASRFRRILVAATLIPLAFAAMLAAALGWQIAGLLQRAQLRHDDLIAAHARGLLFLAIIGLALFGGLMAAMLRRAAVQLRGSRAAAAHAATHDRLTGLPNRALLDDRMMQSIAHARRNDRCVGVLFVDLDGFKHVNDTLGHAAGDDLLAAFARRLAALVRSGDTVARIGGDEFVVVADDLGAWEDVRTIAQKILRAATGRLGSGAARCDVSASIGVSVYPCDGDKPASLVHRADVAMYRAKLGGGGDFRLFRELPASLAANG